MTKTIFQNLIQNAPEKPGIYQMFGEGEVILYIGKAKNIKKRLLNYINNNLSTKTILLINQVKIIEFITTSTESEALILEARLIRKHQPKYNVLLKDDKSFPYIMVREDHAFPQVIKYRGKIINKENKFFGPFANAGEVNNALKFIQKTFKLRNCTDAFFESRKRPCLQYQIQRCSAPCVGKISAEEYKDSVKQAVKFLQGECQELQKDLALEMEKASDNLEFEKAAIIRDRIKNLSYIQLGKDCVKGEVIDSDAIAALESCGIFCIAICFYRNGQFYGQKLYFPEAHDNNISEVISSFISLFYQNTIPASELLINFDIEDIDIIEKALKQMHGISTKIRKPIKGVKKNILEVAINAANEGLQTKIKTEKTKKEILDEISKLFKLDDTPRRIEIFDNSHIMGSHAVGAMVVATREGFNKKEYRIYNVENKIGDDYAILEEVLQSRMKRIKEKNGEIPDLMIIDGGKGHLSRAIKVMEKQGLVLKIVAMSKGIDRNSGKEIFHMMDNTEFTLDRNMPVMKYLQILRDEAHNFAISKHRAKRSKSLYFSSLDNIESIGKKRKKALLNYFGGIEPIKAASIEELAKAPGISNAIAIKIFESFHKL